MSDPAWLGFIAALTIASGFFFFKHRRFDLVTVAYIGAAFYFSPMIFGSVIVPYSFDASIPSQAYWIASAYLTVDRRRFRCSFAAFSGAKYAHASADRSVLLAASRARFDLRHR